MKRKLVPHVNCDGTEVFLVQLSLSRGLTNAIDHAWGLLGDGCTMKQFLDAVGTLKKRLDAAPKSVSRVVLRSAVYGDVTLDLWIESVREST